MKCTREVADYRTRKKLGRRLLLTKPLRVSIPPCTHLKKANKATRITTRVIKQPVQHKADRTIYCDSLPCELKSRGEDIASTFRTL